MRWKKKKEILHEANRTKSKRDLRMTKNIRGTKKKEEKWEIIERNLRGREEGDEKERVGGKEEREGTKSNREQKVGKEEGNYFWVSFV